MKEEAGLTNAQMSINTSIPSSPRQVLILSIRNMQVGLWVSILFRQSEINHVHLVPSLANSHQEIVGLDVSVDKVSRVDVFDS